MPNPKVSVIMAVYNSEKFLKEAIESILNQTFKDFEFIIIDDGSTDRSGEILEDYAKKDSRIKVFHQENMGLTKSLNKAIKLAKGEYIARMDADDISMPERLEEQIQFLDQNPQVALLGTGYYEIDTFGKVIKKKRPPTSDTELRRVLIKYNPFFHASVMIRKNALQELRLYDENLKYAQDYDLWLRISSKFKIANLSDILMMRRYTKKMLSFFQEREQIKCAVIARLRALRCGNYPEWYYLYLLRPCLSFMAPLSIKNPIRKWFLESGKIISTLENEK